MCKLRRITHKFNIKPFGLYSICEKIKFHSYSGLFVLFMSCVCHAFASVQCCLVVTCLERADLLLSFVMFYWVFVTVPCGILGQVWYLIVSIPDLCHLFYYHVSPSLYVCENYRNWRDYAFTTAHLKLHCSNIRNVPKCHKVACIMEGSTQKKFKWSHL